LRKDSFQGVFVIFDLVQQSDRHID
jgi:hypothetical protein